jgi:hypothetical protein
MIQKKINNNKKIETKFDRWKKLKGDEIKKKSFQKEQIVIKKTWSKSERKYKLKGCFQNVEVQAWKSRRKKKMKRLLTPSWRSVRHKHHP